MDAKIVAEPMVLGFAPVAPEVVTAIKVDELIKQLVSLFDVSTVLRPLIRTGNSPTAVAPNTLNKRGVGAWA